MMTSDDEGELDRILGGVESDQLGAMNSSPQQPNCEEEALARGLLFPSLIVQVAFFHLNR